MVSFSFPSFLLLVYAGISCHNLQKWLVNVCSAVVVDFIVWFLPLFFTNGRDRLGQFRFFLNVHHINFLHLHITIHDTCMQSLKKTNLTIGARINKTKVLELTTLDPDPQGFNKYAQFIWKKERMAYLLMEGCYGLHHCFILHITIIQMFQYFDC